MGDFMTISDIMVNVTQTEFNKACSSRNFSVLDNMRGQIQIELLVIEDKIEQMRDDGEVISKSLQFKLKVIKHNLDRIERRIGEIVERNERRSIKIREDKEKLDLALMHAREYKKDINIRQEISQAKSNVDLEELRRVDPVAYRIALQMNAGKSLDEIALEAKEKESNQYQMIPHATELKQETKLKEEDKPLYPGKFKGPSVEDAFKPNQDGNVDL